VAAVLLCRAFTCLPLRRNPCHRPVCTAPLRRAFGGRDGFKLLLHLALVLLNNM
jgi:hypothetical protein